MKVKLSDYVMTFLETKNTKHVFTISGGGCMHLIDSLGKSNIEYICNHHEQALAMAVEGYARMEKGVGVGLVTTGPGGTNTITGLVGCWLDSIPAIFISGQVPTSQLSEGTGCRQIGDQEFDIVDMVKNITKYAVTVKNKNDIKYCLEKAFYKMKEGRQGPVWIDIPLDIQASTIDTNSLKIFVPPRKHKKHYTDLEYVVKKIENSKKPLFVVGNGVRLSGARKTLLNLLKKTQIPVVTGPHSGVDIVNESYENYAGRIGVLGHRSSNKIIQECDLMIAIGTRLGYKMTGYKQGSFAKNAYKILVDVDENEMNKENIEADLKIKSDAKIFLEKLNKHQYKNINIFKWIDKCRGLRKQETYVFKKHRDLKNYASNYCFVEGLSKLVPENIPTVTSNGSAHVITLQTMKLKGDQRLFTNVGCASMGYGLPAAIGACFANERKPIVCIEGDGSIQMNIQELQTIIHHKLPIKMFVINNDAYLSIKATQDNYFNSNYVGTNTESGVSLPDLKKISNAYGISYENIKNNNEIDEKIQKVLDHNDGPIICEVYTYPKEKHEPKVVAKIKEDGTFEPGELTNMHISETF